jgi:hypothetical protein
MAGPAMKPVPRRVKASVVDRGMRRGATISAIVGPSSDMKLRRVHLVRGEGRDLSG